MSEPGLFDDVEWLRRQWAMLNDGGVWAIPRSGIVLQKDEASMEWRVSALMPWMPEMAGTITAEELREQQHAEIEGIRTRVEVLGITIPPYEGEE